MKIKRFNIHEDLSHVNLWLTARGLDSVNRHVLPEMGYMMWDNSQPMGAVFLRRCEGGLGIIDSLITKPSEAPEVRDFVVESLSKHIIEVAKSSKINTLVAFSVDNNTIKRSLRLGFTQSPQTVVAMNLLKSGSS